MNLTTELKKILETSRDQRELERAAVSLASSSNESDLFFLESYLLDSGFLARLDSVRDPQVKTFRFHKVIEAVGKNPSPVVGKLLQSLLKSRTVTAVVERIDLILAAAALGKPMTLDRIAVFRMASPDLYLPSNLALLVNNGEKLSLDELRHEITNKPQEMPDQPVIAIMHRSFLTHRTDPGLARMAQELVHDHISESLKIGVFESFFTYQPDRWFGPVVPSPQPAPYETASSEALQELLQLAQEADSSKLPADLRKLVENSAEKIKAILETRSQR